MDWSTGSRYFEVKTVWSLKKLTLKCLASICGNIESEKEGLDRDGLSLVGVISNCSVCLDSD